MPGGGGGRLQSEGLAACRLELPFLPPSASPLSVPGGQPLLESAPEMGAPFLGGRGPLTEPVVLLVIRGVVVDKVRALLLVLVNSGGGAGTQGRSPRRSHPQVLGREGGARTRMENLTVQSSARLKLGPEVVEGLPPCAEEWGGGEQVSPRLPGVVEVRDVPGDRVPVGSPGAGADEQPHVNVPILHRGVGDEVDPGDGPSQVPGALRANWGRKGRGVYGVARGSIPQSAAPGGPNTGDGSCRDQTGAFGRRVSGAKRIPLSVGVRQSAVRGGSLLRPGLVGYPGIPLQGATRVRGWIPRREGPKLNRRHDKPVNASPRVTYAGSQGQRVKVGGGGG